MTDGLELLEAPTAPSAAEESPSSRPRRQRSATRRNETAVRVACHLAAEVPILVLALVQSVRGWRPVFDDAALSFRSWDVFSSHLPLLGHQLTGPYTVYAPGPLEYWLLAIPVHLDPGHGSLWGAALLVMVGVALAIEASWAVGRRPAAAVTAAMVIVLLGTRPDLTLDPLWNPSLGAFWLATTLATGWACATGRLGWWPPNVLAASLVAQSHEAFVLPALGVCVVCPLVGLAWRHRRGLRWPWRWLPVGLIVGLACWSGPLVQELTAHPGNLTLLWRTSRRHVATIGYDGALRAFAAATRPFPEWLHIPRRGSESLVDLVNTFGGAPWWGVLVLLALATGAVVAWAAGRRALCAASAICLVASLASLQSVADLPASGFLTLSYVDVLWWMVGMAVWAVLLWLVLAALRAGGRYLLGRAPAFRVPSARIAVARRVGAVGLLAAVPAFALWALTSNLVLVPSVFNDYGGWGVVRTTNLAAARTAAVAPHAPFRLVIRGGPNSAYDFAVLTGSAYQIHTENVPVRVIGLASSYFGAWTMAPVRVPTVAIYLGSSFEHPSVTVVAPRR